MARLSLVGPAGRVLRCGHDELASVGRVSIPADVTGGFQPVEHQSHGRGGSVELTDQLGGGGRPGGDAVIHHLDTALVDTQFAGDVSLEPSLANADVLHAGPVVKGLAKDALDVFSGLRAR